MTELICLNLNCTGDDPEIYCPRCGNEMVPFESESKPVALTFNCHFTNRVPEQVEQVRQALDQIDKEIINRAAIKAMDTPYGERIDFADCLGMKEEN